MSESDDTAAEIDRAISESQKQERVDRDADLERQVSADENLVDVLSHKDDDPETRD